MNKADLVKEWFEIASTDLHTAVHLFETMRPKPLEIICYHCQQAAEKALKAYLIDCEIEPPRIHDLEKLCQICAEQNPAFETMEDICGRLTDYSVSTRYPDHPEIEETDAASALKDADRICEFCAALCRMESPI
jgi:HEPN domain-containing protein